MDESDRWAKRFDKLVIVVGIVGLTIFIGAFILFVTRYFTSFEDNDWKTKTSALSGETIQYLCQVFSQELDKLETLCSSDEDVYISDFFPVIVKAFPPFTTTYSDVNKRIGKYQTDEETWELSGSRSQYRRVWYDIKGDGITKIVIRYNKENTVERITLLLGDDP